MPIVHKIRALMHAYATKGVYIFVIGGQGDERFDVHERADARLHVHHIQ